MTISDPRGITGLVRWCSAEYEAQTRSDGDSMSGTGTWHDLSGNNYHLSCGSAVVFKNTADGPFIRADGSTNVYITGGSNTLSGATASHLFTKPRVFDTATETRTFVANTNSGQGQHFPWSDHNIYDGYGFSSRQSYSGTAFENSFGQWDVGVKAGSYKARINGSVVSNVTSGSVGWGGSTDLIFNGGYAFWKGDNKYVIQYDHQLTTTEQADLDTWLAAHPDGGFPAVTQTPSIGMATDTEIARPLSISLINQIALDRASEADIARQVSPSAGAVNLNIARASSTSTARAIRRPARPFGAEESEFGFAPEDISTGFDDETHTLLLPA